ncbi:MAG: BCAM0308 family protein [Burkholderiales bacterium]
MKTAAPRHTRRKDHILDNGHLDPYQLRGKIKGPLRCPKCSAVYRRGNWRWEVPPVEASEHECPACRRIREGYPAGTMQLSGEFFNAHREEILNLVRNQEKVRKESHPLQRIMTFIEHADHVELTTTDVHIARRIGDALLDAFQGDLSVGYSPGEHFVRVSWKR